MTPPLLHRGWVRPGLIMVLVGNLLATLFLLRPQPVNAAREAAREVFVTPPLDVAPGQSAEIAFFLPAVQNQGKPAPVRLQLVDAETGQVLAQKDITVGVGPGGGCLQLPASDLQRQSRQEIIGILIGLFQPNAPQPTASLQIFDTDTQKTTAALPAVQRFSENTREQ